jgi:hypothetical protein
MAGADLVAGWTTPPPGAISLVLDGFGMCDNSFFLAAAALSAAVPAAAPAATTPAATAPIAFFATLFDAPEVRASDLVAFDEAAAVRDEAIFEPAREAGAEVRLTF